MAERKCPNSTLSDVLCPVLLRFPKMKCSPDNTELCGRLLSQDGETLNRDQLDQELGQMERKLGISPEKNV